MEHILADHGLRLTCLSGPARTGELHRDCIFADLWDEGVANSLLPWHGGFRLDDQDFLVMVSDCKDNRCLGLLAASLRATEREPFLLLEAAYVTPAESRRNLLQRMAAFALLNIARLDAVPHVVAACAVGEDCRGSLQDLQRQFTAASVFPRPDAAVVELGMAGLARRIARVVWPVACYEAGSGVLRAAGVEHALVVLELSASDDATIVEDARRVYRTRATLARAAGEMPVGPLRGPTVTIRQRG